MVLEETDSGTLEFRLAPTLHGLVSGEHAPAVICVDIPIGLPSVGKRICDLEARAVLGQPRCCSVFPVPIRPALAARSRLEASAITRAADGRGVGVQAWAIYPRIAEMNEVLTSGLAPQTQFREVHPEVCFWALNAGKPMTSSKKSVAGRLEREALLVTAFGEDKVQEMLHFPRRKDRAPKTDLADDDILDALAALWTAERVSRGEARTIPGRPPADPLGLRMEIVY